jgi:cysteine-rich repeat protein
VPACGEACDDGNALDGDGCSSLCQAEGVTDRVSFSGTGQGGSIEISVNGVPLGVPTFEGDSAVDVARRVSEAINDDPILAGSGVSAVFSVDRVDLIGGVFDHVTSSDPGIQVGGAPPVPASSPAGRMLLALLLGSAGAVSLLGRLRRAKRTDL